MKTVLGFSALALAATALPLQAASITYTDSIALQATNWSDTLSVSQFDTSLGTLNFVSVVLVGGLMGAVQAENIGTSKIDATLNLRAEVTASTTALGTFVTATPEAATNVTLQAFDTALDFDGASGVTLAGLTDFAGGVSVLTGSNTAEFTGTGTVSLDIDAANVSNTLGGGTVLSLYQANASATLIVTYDYTEAVIAPVPLPAGLPLTAGGMVLLGLMAQRKRG